MNVPASRSVRFTAAAPACELLRLFSIAVGGNVDRFWLRRMILRGLLPAPAYRIGRHRMWSPSQVNAALAPETVEKMKQARKPQRAHRSHTTRPERARS